MPVRSRGQLLAGIGALLSVCAAGTGCQSMASRIDPFTGSPIATSRPTPVGAYLAAPQPAGVQVSQVTTVLRPVSATAADNDNVVSSTWHDTQHLADGSVTSGVFVARTPMPLNAAARAAMDAPLPTEDQVPVAQNQGDPLQPSVQPVSHMVYQHGDLPAAGIPGVPREFDKQSYPLYRVEPPDVLFINASSTLTFPNTQPLIGPFLIRMDGFINLGIYGEVYVAGLTLEQVKDAVAAQLKLRTDPKDNLKLGDDGRPLPADKQPPMRKSLTIEQIKLELQVDVTAFNSKVYYIITDGAGFGEQVVRVPATGNETVLDALGLINGLPGVSSKKHIWIARATPQGSAHPLILPVDWCGITKYGLANTNYQIFPGDRIYVDSQGLLKADSALSKFLNPVNRLLGTVLLGSGTVNSIRNSNGNGTGSQ